MARVSSDALTHFKASMKRLTIKKLYYSISEVSEMTSLKPYVLRYWETEFPQLRPSKNRAGNRIYRANDIKIIERIKKLLYEEKYTIQGAKKKLQQELSRSKPDGNPQLGLNLSGEDKNKVIDELRRELQNILGILDNK